MKQKALLAVALTALITMGGAAVAQRAATPATPIKVAPIPANTVGGAGRSEAMIKELQAQIDVLAAELAATRKDLASMKAAQGTTTAKALEAHGMATALRKDFDGHSHYSPLTNISGDKQTIVAHESSIPKKYCSLNQTATFFSEKVKCVQPQ